MHSKIMKYLILIVLLTIPPGLFAGDVKVWGIFEVVMQGPADGNPFRDVQLKGVFSQPGHEQEVNGFYDGKGVYKIRFMPDRPGRWSYVTWSSAEALNGSKGFFVCDPAEPGNHGPVRVNGQHFSYADGERFVPVGTTLYAWTHQTVRLEEQTLKTLSHAPFNKVRMCVFPKNFLWNQNDPLMFPYVRDSSGNWDYERFNPSFFRHFENRVKDLMDMGIEADIILFHPYDYGKWGFSNMGRESDLRYLKYLISRLAPYRNVWWSIANEHELLENKTTEDWDNYFRMVEEEDPYGHLRSIHNKGGLGEYDHGKPWVTHLSLQYWSFDGIRDWRKKFGKPLINDEPEYEGNVGQPWGSLTGRELVRRFWELYTTGCYATHGEVFLDTRDIIWWSKGGGLKGTSPHRIAFLKKILEEEFTEGIEPMEDNWMWSRIRAGKTGRKYILYFGNHQPAYWRVRFGKGEQFRIRIVDTWDMTVETQEKIFSNGDTVFLPQKPFLAIIFEII